MIASLPDFSETTLAGGADDDRLVIDIAVDFTGSVAINGRLLGDDGDDRLEADGFAIARTSQDSKASALVYNVLFGGGGGDELSATASARAEGDGAPARAFNVLYGGDGNDSLSAEATAIGGFSLTSARNDLQGGAGDDVLRGVIDGDVAPEADGASHLHGGDGNDSLAVVGGAYNLLDGGAGDDGLAGGSGIDWLRGGAGNDILEGRGGADMLYGGAGDDRLAGGAGDDALEGREGNDVLGGGDGNDKLWGETLDLLKAFVAGGDGDDELSGGNGDDQLHGGLGANLIDGGNGNDTLFGGLGDDTIKGGDGDDFFSAETISDASRGLFVTTSAGDDEIFGGEGNDTFAYSGSGAFFDHDTLRDFTHSEDKIAIFSMRSLRDFADLDSNGSGRLDDGDARVTADARGTVLDLSNEHGRGAGTDTITVAGVDDLRADDFLFA